MNVPSVRIKTETPTRTGQRIDLTNCISFSIENQGDTNAKLGYPGEGGVIDLEPGSVREYACPWGHLFEGELEVEFETGTGKLLVQKLVSKNTVVI